jgi:hypothetical protein
MVEAHVRPTDERPQMAGVIEVKTGPLVECPGKIDRNEGFR